MTESPTPADRDRVEQYAENHPRLDATEILPRIAGDLEADLPTARALVEDVVGETDADERDFSSPPNAPGRRPDRNAADPGLVTESNGNAAPEDVRHTSGSCRRESETPAGEDPGEHTGDASGARSNDYDIDPSETATDAGEDPDPDAGTPGFESGGSGSNSPDDVESAGSDESGAWDAAEFAAPESGEWPATLADREQWMGRAGETGKQPFAPWADRDHPDAAPDDDARWKWGLDENHAPKDVVDEWVGKDPRVAGYAFIQTDADPLAFVDGDDVRDPETGEVHPAFVAILERLGLTYADVSTSGAGVHAYYRGDLPDGVKQAVFEIDTDPWGANDDPPTVEIYSGKHVCVATGEHVPGTPDDVEPWDPDALEAVLDEHDQLPSDPVGHDTDRDRDDLEDHTPDATARDETTDDVRDILSAVDDLEPSDVRLKSTETGEDSTGWTTWDPNYRPSESGESLHYNADGVFHDHKHGEAFGVLSLFAAEQNILTDPWDRLRGADWWEAVDAARDAGAPVPEYVGTRDGDTDPVAVLPNSPKARALANGFDWTTDDRHADDGLTIDDARERTKDAIAETLEGYKKHRLVHALPTMGKSYGSVLAAAETGQPVTILAGRGHKEQYDQIEGWCDELGLTCKPLPSFTHDCPTAAGEHGAEWADRVDDWYRRGATPKEIHKRAEDVLGRPLPCQVDDDGNHIGCQYAREWNFDPDEHPDTGEEWDVLLGHYTHAHKQKVTSGRGVLFDEFPGGAYETELDEYLAPAVTHYLQTTDAVPFDDFADLLEHRDDDERRESALEFFEDVDLAPAEGQVFDGDRTHAYAPLATYTILAGRDLGNGLRRADLGDGRIGLVDGENGQVLIRNPPPLDPARNVVALDGTPTPEMWEIALGTWVNHRQVLSDDERREYIADVLDHRYIRTTEYVKPYNSEGHVSVDRDAALLEQIAEDHNRKPALVTTSTAEDVYQQAGILGTPGDDGIATEGDLASAGKHYGDVLGSNRFKTTRLGAVIGSNHYGDDYIKKWGAYAGEAVERDGDGRGGDLGYTGIGDDVLQHMREHDTLQAAMRFGRDGNGAVVYVHTDTLPEWVPVAGEGRVIDTWSEGMKAVATALDDLETATSAEIADHPAVDVGTRQVRDHLARLAEDMDAVERECHPEDRRKWVWRADGLHRVGEHGDVELDPVDLEDLDDDEEAELARTTIYTWEFRNSSDSTRSTPAESEDTVDRAVANAGDPSSEGDPPPG
jgi:hypothetical protein